MRLTRKLSQHRRDFTGEYECEKCGFKNVYGGCYDDRNFHDNVTPTWKCEECGESTESLGLIPARVETMYPPNQSI